MSTCHNSLPNQANEEVQQPESSSVTAPTQRENDALQGDTDSGSLVEAFGDAADQDESVSERDPLIGSHSPAFSTASSDTEFDGRIELQRHMDEDTTVLRNGAVRDRDGRPKKSGGRIGHLVRSLKDLTRRGRRGRAQPRGSASDHHCKRVHPSTRHRGCCKRTEPGSSVERKRADEVLSGFRRIRQPSRRRVCGWLPLRRMLDLCGLLPLAIHDRMSATIG